jgi:pyridoxal phosphate enzyme (YggS family)
MSIAENVERIRARIAAAACKAGRSPDEISLVAATKMNSAENVRAAVAAGIDASGENRVQEMLEKLAQNAYTGAPLHFIGHLQKNKVRQVVGVCDLIQSVGSAELVTLIGKKAVSLGICQDILIEVNIGREPAKSGVMAEELDCVLQLAAETKGIRVCGLMAIPPISTNPGGNRNYFDQMYHLFVDMRDKKYDNVNMCTLSMGMSGDFEDAIASGATMVRVGSAIFGERMYG